jgi:hypothetical protein
MNTLTSSTLRGALVALLAGATLAGCGGPADAEGGTSAPLNRHDDGGKGSVSSHLGGRAGILAFLETLVVPAELADPEIAPFFTRLTETPGDIEECLANLLDHDLGGESPHFGAVLADGHQCRSSMSNIHRGLAIPDRIVTKFIMIVGQQAALAGVAPSDVQAVADALESYRGGVRNK